MDAHISMLLDPAACAAVLLIVGILLWPLFDAARRRRFGLDASEVAGELQQFAERVRGAAAVPALEDAVLARARSLRVPEVAVFALAQELARGSTEPLAAAAQRLATRLRRRVAFERKMLARTASGRRRGAIAAVLPPLILLLLAMSHAAPPPEALAFVVLLEAFSAWLLWRVARVAP